MELFAESVSRDPEIKEALINIEAWGLAVRLNKSSISVYARNGLLLIELHNKPQILFFAQEMGYIVRPDSAGAIPDEPAGSTIARLEHELATERALRLRLAEERAALEERLKARRPAPADADARYTKLKKMLAREFHPDQCRGTAFERKYRADFFKVLWAKVEEIDKS